ncbi:helix-turn-helix domain-containing protein [Salidesulfovibrio brasiliensis]|uniref:helix-turn-helix domain-containing protein n=1 Tax=Salidesulfovibrio brasiliensis TaxID=221711 RepID=UPI0009FABAF2|nr:helix-turn-helix domain-containing protein [Salidesulfovibrio brasiliensis]
MLNSKKESGSAGKHETDSLESAFNIVIVEAPQKHSCLLWRKYQEKRGRAVLYYLGKVKKFQSEEIIIRLAGPQVVDFFRCQKGIASSVKEVLRQLILINRIHGKCFPSHGWIAEKIGVCRRTVQRAIKVLSSLGIISTSKSQHRRSLSYLIHLCEKVFGKFWPRTLEAKSKTKLRQVSCPEVSCPADVEEMITVVAQKRATKKC